MQVQLTTIKFVSLNALPKALIRLILLTVTCLLAPTAVADVNADVESRVKTILSGLSLEEKVGQMVQGEIKWVSPSDVTKYHLGSVLNGGGSFPNQRKNSSIDDWLKLADSYYKASVKTKSGIPLIWGTDAVHGHNNVVGATLFPHNIGLGAANDPELLKEIGAITAREVAATGIDWIFAPTVAVVKDDRWGRTYEGYSDESPIVRAYGGKIVEGLQGTAEQLRTDSEKVIASAKHWIGDGGTFRGEDQGNTIMSLDDLLDQHGQGYVTALDAGVQTVMASFNSWNGEKLHGHKFLITDVLKEQMGFDGFVVSDWNGIGQVEGCTNQSCAQSINAGVDMLMVPEDWKQVYKNTLAQVRSGEISMARIDDAVSRILRVKLRAGMFEKPAPSMRKITADSSIIGSAKHRAVARDAVRKSLVMLKNRQQILPLKPAQHVLVTGDGADNIGKQNGGWTITWQGTENLNSDFPGATSIYAGIDQAMSKIGGTTELSADGSFVKKPDVAVVVFGENPYAEGSGDRDSLLHDEGLQTDLKLLRKLKQQGIPVVSVLLTGRPLWVNAELNSSDAFVVAWLPGSEGGGIADVIVADAQGKPRFDFTGKLSFDWPAAEINASNRDLPVAEYLMKSGQGLAYGDAEMIAENLNEKSLIDNSSKERLVFSGTTRSPWKAYVGDASDWRKLVSGKSTSTAYGALTVTTVDGAVQEDSRRVEWGSGHESQFYWQTDNSVNLSDLPGDNPALMMTFAVDKHPEGRVTLRMDCEWPCRGELPITRLLRAQPEGKLTKMGISLACFTKFGVDLRKVNSPLVLVASEPFAITFRDVRVVGNAPSPYVVKCN
ncbi:MAG: glycoside hydrolase family 3 protein [Porticoccaceae bacterium]